MFKKRTPYGAFIDKHKIAQERVKEESGLNKDTITRACNEESYKPKKGVAKLLVNAARNLTNQQVNESDFW